MGEWGHLSRFCRPWLCFNVLHCCCCSRRSRRTETGRCFLLSSLSPQDSCQYLAYGLEGGERGRKWNKNPRVLNKQVVELLSMITNISPKIYNLANFFLCRAFSWPSSPTALFLRLVVLHRFLLLSGCVSGSFRQKNLVLTSCHHQHFRSSFRESSIGSSFLFRPACDLLWSSPPYAIFSSLLGIELLGFCLITPVMAQKATDDEISTSWRLKISKSLPSVHVPPSPLLNTLALNFASQ